MIFSYGEIQFDSAGFDFWPLVTFWKMSLLKYLVYIMLYNVATSIYESYEAKLEAYNCSKIEDKSITNVFLPVTWACVTDSGFKKISGQLS